LLKICKQLLISIKKPEGVGRGFLVWHGGTPNQETKPDPHKPSLGDGLLGVGQGDPPLQAVAEQLADARQHQHAQWVVDETKSGYAVEVKTGLDLSELKKKLLNLVAYCKATGAKPILAFEDVPTIKPSIEELFGTLGFTESNFLRY